MAPTFLIVGATGNTGRSVVSTLSEKLDAIFPNHRILALTRSKDSSAAKELAKLPGVEVAEKNWVDIDSTWLKEQSVKRAFIASHNAPNQFAEESTFHLECLKAGVEYVVRISTTAANVSPTCEAYYPRTHWAIEQLLGSPEFAKMGWSSLQPNIFTQMFLGTAAAFVQEYKKTGKQRPLRLIANENGPVGSIDPSEVGTFAATLLLQQDTTPYHGKKFELNGPDDITGQQIVEMVEKEIGTKVEDVRYKDVSFLEQMADAQPHETRSVIMSIRFAPVSMWEGKATSKTTSKEVLDLCPPKKSIPEVWREMLKE